MQDNDIQEYWWWSKGVGTQDASSNGVKWQGMLIDRNIGGRTMKPEAVQKKHTLKIQAA